MKSRLIRWDEIRSLPFRLGALPFALTALAVKQTDSGRPFVERHAKHVAP